MVVVVQDCAFISQMMRRWSGHVFKINLFVFESIIIIIIIITMIIIVIIILPNRETANKNNGPMSVVWKRISFPFARIRILRRTDARQAAAREHPNPLNMAHFTYSRLSHLLRLSVNSPSVLRTWADMKPGPVCCALPVRCQVSSLPFYCWVRHSLDQLASSFTAPSRCTEERLQTGKETGK